MTPSQEYARTQFCAPKPLLKGLDARVHAWIGAYHRRAGVLRQLTQQAHEIDTLAPRFATLSDFHLQEQLREFRDLFRRGGKKCEPALIPALAAIREAAERTVGLRPFVVQLVGALALHRGYLAEMATGEGKTLTAGLAAVLFGWTKKPCHIVTVNDYLVERDANWLKPLYTYCGVKVGFVTSSMSPEERRKGYGCDITYTTSKEVVADFLRDTLRVGALRNPTRRLIRRMLMPAKAEQDGLVLRGLHTAIIDEADSVLIDEAVTPLIISAQHKNEALREVAQLANQIVEPFATAEDYEINYRYREVELTRRGLEKLESRCSCLPGIWQGPSRRLELVKQALVAREFFHRGKQYVVVDGKVVIVDEFTGRPMPQRTWRQGMHQAIEAKENLPISDPTDTMARLSFQRYFRLYYKLAGMTGTAKEAAAEFWQIYKLPVVTIPPNKPCIRVQQPDQFFAREEEKFDAIVRTIVQLHKIGRPVLVGTRSVAVSESLAARLQDEGLSFRILNAVRHQEEAQIIAEAGEEGRITIATNMAGRGTDIRLGRGVAELGGLHVIATERHESQRVDRQLFGRSARQGDPGSAQAFVSAEDELFRRYLPQTVQQKMKGFLEHSSVGSQTVATTFLALAQRKAQRLAFRARKNVLKMDDWMDEALSFAGPEI